MVSSSYHKQSIVRSWDLQRTRCGMYIDIFSIDGSHGCIVVSWIQSVPITIKSCEFESCSWRGVLDTTLYDKVCQWLATGQWFSWGTLVYERRNTKIKNNLHNEWKNVFAKTINMLIQSKQMCTNITQWQTTKKNI